MRIRLVLGAVLLSLCLATGCRFSTDPVTEPDGSASIEITVTTAVPDMPAAQTVAPEATPTLAASEDAQGVTVTGVLTAGGDSAPHVGLAGTTVYLAEMLMASGSPSGLASMDEAEAPAAEVDDQGAFVFSGVEPGMYALIIKTPISLIVAHDLTTDSDIVFTAEAGQDVDLGTILVIMPY
jgi:hypothetical protein